MPEEQNRNAAESRESRMGEYTMNSESKVAHTQSARTTSPRKVEANRRNAKRSTGPRTPEGKTTSSLNAVTHGIFVKRFLNGAAPETVAEIQALISAVREHYKPQGPLEEILVQKVVVEAARYDRILGFEHEQIARPHAFHISRGVDCISRYTTSTSRALFRAIEELERVQAVRKASESSAVPSCEHDDTSVKPEEKERAPQAANSESGESSTLRGAAGGIAA